MRIRSFIPLVALGAVPLMAQQPAPPPQIVTSARGEVSATPDRATILFAVETHGKSAAGAGAQNARTQRAVLDTLRALGFSKGDLSTVGYSVSPEYDYNNRDGKPPLLTGYVARNAVRVNVRKIDLVGPAIDAALAKGSNNVSSLQFETSQIDSVRRAAMKEAVGRARADAEAMAVAAGGSLGSLIEATINDFMPQPMMMMRAQLAKSADATPIEPGEQDVAVTVTTRWLFIAGK